MTQLGRVLDQLPCGQDVAGIAWKSLLELTSYHKMALDVQTEIESVHGEAESLGEGFLDPDPEMTKDRIAALDRLQQLAGAETNTDEFD